MAVKKSIPDREKLKSLRQRESDASAALKAHRKICGDCHGEHNWPRHACDDGWTLAKAAAKAANDLLVYSGEQPAGELPGQGQLW